MIQLQVDLNKNRRQGTWVTVAMENVYKIKMVELPKYTEYKAELL